MFSIISSVFLTITATSALVTDVIRLEREFSWQKPKLLADRGAGN
ncbi:MAG: hypothetical protein ACOX4Q_00885 [Syntrophomonadales bacterium]